MTQILIKLFIKNYENLLEPKVRDAYGNMAGVVGIATNTMLSAMKILIGLAMNSIAILADGLNNLMDATSSIIMLFGFKLAAKPSDEEHPYGHARAEYLAGIIISLLMVVLGFQLLLSSVDKIRNQETIAFSSISVVILVIAILIKFWQYRFYIKIADTIESITIKATSTDSRNDVITTSAVLASLLINHWTGLQLDGIMGSLVALFIIYSGIKLIIETSSPLLGLAPNAELVDALRDRICTYQGVLGIHDLVVHDYGPGRTFASVHIEVDAKEDFIKSHDMIDDIEHRISLEYKIHLVAHMDPVETHNPLVIEIREKVQEIAKNMKDVISLHDFRMVPGYTHTNIIFDVVITKEGVKRESEIKSQLIRKVKEIDESYFAVITIDHNYTTF